MSGCVSWNQRALVLPAVLVIMTIALLVGTGMLFLAQAEVAGMDGAQRQAQTRGLAWSGVQAVMGRLDEQRRILLDGGLPELDTQYTIYEYGDRLGVVRLLPLNDAGDRLIAESGKFDLNAVTAEMLTATGMVDASLAAAIVAYRDGTARGTIQSEAELLHVPGMTAEMLYGRLEDLAVGGGTAGVGAEQRASGAQRFAQPREENSLLRCIADVVTVYGYEPALQRSGRLRINLNVPWSDELEQRVRQRWDENAARLLRQIFENGTKFDSEKKLYQVLRFFSVEPKDWPDIVDALTADHGNYHFGRVNINCAPREVLAALPGLNEDLAAQLIAMRDAITMDERSTVAWPAIKEIVPPEAYDELAGWVTTRSWTFRLRIAAGEVDAESPDGELHHPMVYGVVIDLSAPRARVAYLRDLTLMDAVISIALGAGSEDEQRGGEAAEGDGPRADSGGVSETARTETQPDRALHEFGAIHQDRRGEHIDRSRSDGNESLGEADGSSGSTTGGESGSSDHRPVGHRVGRWRPAVFKP